VRSLLRSVALLSVVAVSPAAAFTWNVPGDVPTIAAAVDSAAAGDSVLIACGTYFEHDIPLSREITILSVTGAADCVTIDAQGLGRVFISDVPEGNARIEGITIKGGSAVSPDPIAGWGGGMFFLSGSPTLVRCDFQGNTATVGGALALTGHGSSTVIDCTFHDNSAEHGAGLLFLSVAATVSGCTIYANSADSLGGGAYASLSFVTMSDCTFHGNSAPEGGGALFGELETEYWVERTILASSLAGEAVRGEDGVTVTLGCSDVHGNAGGDWVGVIAGQVDTNGNFSEDPLFCDPSAFEFQLLPTSPCLPGNHPDGADCGIIGAHGECTTAGVADAQLLASPVLSVSPNPFRGSARVEWELPRRGASRIAIFDVGGRMLRTFDANARSGTIRWDGTSATGQRVAAGVYFVRLDGAGYAATKRVLLVR
jgi:predicted outer membrane repeat protein